MLLLRLHHLALRLRPWLPLCCVLGCAAAATALILIFQEGAEPSPLLGIALGLAAWTLMLFAFIRLFQSIPAPVLPKDSFFERLWSRCKLALYHLLAAGIVLVGIALVAMSLKLLSVSVG